MSENKNENMSGNIYELYDESGEKSLFEHLDTVKLGDDEYCIFVPYDENEEEGDEVLDVAIFQIIKDEDGEDALILLEDEETLDSVYDIFKERNADLFDFDN